MTKYIKGKDSKFAGSIGAGKSNVPKSAPTIPAAASLGSHGARPTTAPRQEDGMNVYDVGDVVTTVLDSQGMLQGVRYEIVDVIPKHSPAGTYYDYTVVLNVTDPSGNAVKPPFTVRNGHILFMPA